MRTSPHAPQFYYYASKQGCESGQKAAIQIVGNHEDNFQQNFNIGVGSYRIKHCDCNHQYRRTTLVDPAHTGAVYGCLSDMPDDQSCCPDPDSGVYYDHSIPMGKGYRNSTGGTDNTGTCIAKSIMAAALERVPIMHHAMTHEDSAARAALAAFDGVDCPEPYIGWNINPSYDPIWGPMCPAYKAIQRCNVASPPADCSYDANWVAWNMPGHEWTYAGSFTDDDGVTHTWTNPTPKIVTHPFAALALIEAGLPATQIHGTYAARGSSGSNLGGAYGNSNRWDADDLDSDNPHAASTLDHANAAHDPDMWAADPTTAEQALLAEMLDLSPTCSSGNGWCSEFNHTILDVNGWPDLIVVGPWFSAWHVPTAVRTAAAARGIPIINFRAKHGVPEFGTELNTAPARLKSFSEHAQRYDALAQALGADPAVNLEVKQEFCREASAFKEATRGAAERGVRALAGLIPGQGATGPDGEIAASLAPPDRNPHLMMLEELGMPLLHLDTAQIDSKPENRTGV